MKVGWINNNELLFDNTADADEGCGGVFNSISSTCVSVGGSMRSILACPSIVGACKIFHDMFRFHDKIQIPM